ncbi:hypothetical protein BEE12_22550 (plasmid) [Pantoea agglomerans]|nr:hypothetical protein BEE12_22550 [Pantoea agglomerans]
MKYVFIEKHQAEFSIKAMCRVLQVSRSGWYACRQRRRHVTHRLGKIRGRKPENQSYRASGLTLLTAAISLWNTVYMERAMDALKRKVLKINEQLLSHLSPLGWEYINLTGDYIWKSNRIPASGKYRRLRLAKVERSKKALTYNNFRYPKCP